jgi:capsular exopolysaccharide synthesis family protein
MKGRYNTVQERLKKLPETEKKLIGIQREFDLNNELYTYMLQKKAESSISKASIAPEVQVIDPAMAEAAIKMGPSMIKTVFVGLFGGFMLPFAFITLIGFFNNKIETREEIEKGSHIPVLEGIIQHKYKVKLPVIIHPRSGIAESFRGLKSNLNAILEQPGAKVVSINSLIPGEGKSFISSNFSAILTKSNKKVLLIGADLHKPTLHQYFDMKETFGLSDYFKNEKSIEEIINPTYITNLSFIQAGPIPNNPSDLLDNTKFEQLVEVARRMFDFIIIDNAPILLVPDAILTSGFSDVSLFVLRIKHSHKDQIKQINKIVDFNRVKRAAIVINEAPDRGYGYGNKYWKKGYGEYKQKMSIA